ncbi:MAG TPA: discoidin domain-containing protein [Bacteroidales bacterium]|nr:discoidin domain-containing protein [Bacteroidales bacterium]
MKKILVVSFIITFILAGWGCKKNSDRYTKGVGIYPGRSSEDFSPELVTDKTYRNIAKFRTVYQSSAYDYNLTAQLLTDGIITNNMPVYINLSSPGGDIPKNEREWLLDNKPVSSMSLQGPDVWIQYGINPEAGADSVDKITLTGTLEFGERKPRGWTFSCMGSDDGENWVELGNMKGYGLPGNERPDPFAAFRMRLGTRPRRNSFFDADSTMPKPTFTFNFQSPGPTRIINISFDFEKSVAYHHYKLTLTAPCADKWSFSAMDFYRDSVKLNVTPSYRFNSSWMSAGSGKEWVYTDLGSDCSFDKIKLYWLKRPKSGSILVSADAENWEKVADLKTGQDFPEEISFPDASFMKGRYVKIQMDESLPGQKYILSEIEVYGTGGIVTKPKPEPVLEGSRIMLSGGGWKLQRSSEVAAGGSEISSEGFKCDDWLVATVPATVLTSYKNAGAIPDPNYDDNQLLISESFFNSDFWYRNEFNVPTDFNGKKIWLNFDGINWKADVYVNGAEAGRIEGAFIRGKFDVSGLVKPGQRNIMAVLIHKNDNIGSVKEQTELSTDKNGGILGADNPTFHASVGWDWIPTIRGRNIGIWNDVYLSMSGTVRIEDPFVSADLPLPDTTSADIKVRVKLVNTGDKPVTGNLSGKFGDIAFIKEVTLPPSETTIFTLDQKEFSQLHFEKPRLWWPKGYGNPELYSCRLSFSTSEGISDEVSFMTGIREMSFTEDNNILNMYINGRRFIGRGGNWGFSESNLAYRGREYDAAVAYHADMNFTMIRNWVGQTADDEFFEACDRHGIMVWQDFCLANPSDGPDPHDPEMFLKNADDVIRRIRNHPSIGIYVGRNEGNPPQVIDSALRRMIAELHPGLHYISNSAMGVVSGGGPYRALPVRDYYLLYGYNKFHSERGMPNVMTYESLEQALRKEYLWPQNNHWGMHDYTLESAQSCASFNEMIEKGFGTAANAEEFTELAQWVNYNGYRGMFEGRSRYRQGLLLWMSHPSWPSMVWQTYDYYLEPTAAYFGCKKASEPVHIQWNPVSDIIEVVNYSGGNRKSLTAKASIFNMDGTLQWEKSSDLSCREDSTVNCFKLVFPSSVSRVHFIKLELLEEGRVISKNFYWRGTEEGNYKALRSLPRINIGYKTKIEKGDNGWLLTTTLTNATDKPALMIRLKVAGKETGERLLPVIYSDNYISLMPGEQEIIRMTLKEEDARGQKPSVEISGFNIN